MSELLDEINLLADEVKAKRKPCPNLDASVFHGEGQDCYLCDRTDTVPAYPALEAWAWGSTGLGEHLRWGQLMADMLGPAFEGAVKWTCWEASIADYQTTYPAMVGKILSAPEANMLSALALVQAVRQAIAAPG